jgi:calmodulin
MAAIATMEAKFSPEHMEEFKKVFAIFDTNNDNIVDDKEFEVMMQSLGHEMDDIIIKQFKKDLNIQETDNITFENFVEILYMITKTSINIDKLIDSFKIFDKEEKGYITMEEFREIITKIGTKLKQSEFDEMMREADIDEDGYVIYSSFINMITQRSINGKNEIENENEIIQTEVME